jgi:hypothetical protein
VHLTGRVPYGRVPRERAPHWCVPHGCVPCGRASHWASTSLGVYLVGMYLAGHIPYGRVPRGRAPHWVYTSLGVHLSGRMCISWGSVSRGFQIFQFEAFGKVLTPYHTVHNRVMASIRWVTVISPSKMTGRRLVEGSAAAKFSND